MLSSITNMNINSCCLDQTKY